MRLNVTQTQTKKLDDVNRLDIFILENTQGLRVCQLLDKEDWLCRVIAGYNYGQIMYLGAEVMVNVIEGMALNPDIESTFLREVMTKIWYVDDGGNIDWHWDKDNYTEEAAKYYMDHILSEGDYVIINSKICRIIKVVHTNDHTKMIYLINDFRADENLESKAQAEAYQVSTPPTPDPPKSRFLRW